MSEWPQTSQSSEISRQEDQIRESIVMENVTTCDVPKNAAQEVTGTFAGCLRHAWLSTKSQEVKNTGPLADGLSSPEEKLKMASYFNNNSPFSGSGSRQELGTDCQREEMYVDFAELGWRDWVVAPNGYNAYRCIGR